MRKERLLVFPAFHKVAGRTVLVVGDGSEAAAKVRLLQETEAHIRLVAEHPSPELAPLIAEGGLEHRAEPFRPDDVEGAVLVFAASGERAEDAAVVAAARAKNIPANAVDIPELCDFYTPALVNRAPVAVAITSTGAGPVLAQRLRARIEAMLHPRLGALASLGEQFRGAAERVLPKGQPRRRFWSAFFEGGVADAALAGRVDEARRLASRLLTKADREKRGFVWLVGAGPGAADLLTLRAQRLLQEADVVVYESGVPEEVVAMGRRDASRVRLRATPTAAADASEVLVRQAAVGRRVVLLAPGDLLAGGWDKPISALRRTGILFELVPGVGSASGDAESLGSTKTLAA